MTLSLLPALVTIYQERISIQQEQTALLILDEVITDWIYVDKWPLVSQVSELNTTFFISYEINEPHLLTACIRWKGANNRQYENCGSGKK